MPSAPCEHDKPGTYVRLDLLPGYAEVGLTCVHGYMVDTVDLPGQLEPSADDPLTIRTRLLPTFT
jgi:hypothetical protein